MYSTAPIELAHSDTKYRFVGYIDYDINDKFISYGNYASKSKIFFFPSKDKKKRFVVKFYV